MLPSTKEAVALELLRSGAAMYGLEMVKASHGQLGRGTIYVLLARLEDKGFVVSTAEPVPGMPGMPRRIYRITGAGHRALAARRAAHSILADGLAPTGQPA
jgi:PadR family transcriptional regulator PadR